MLFGTKKSAHPLKTAVIGCGYLGKFHAEKYAKLYDSELTAVVDVSAESAKRIADTHRATALTDYRQLKDLGVQCVSVVTPTSTHYEIASWLLNNGIDVLVEKPITATIQQARELTELAASQGRILQVGHLERFNPAFRAMRDVIQNPRFFEVRRIAEFSGRGADVDVVLDLMIHDIDIVAHLVGRPLVRVEALGIPVLTQSVDIANARLTFEGGAIANVTASRAAFKSERSIRVFQPDSYISMDYGKKKLKIYTKGEGTTALGFPKVEIQEMPVREADALEEELKSFLVCVRERCAPEVGGDEGVQAMELALQITRAFRDSWAPLGLLSDTGTNFRAQNG